jgi:hypothetical protein
MSLFEPNVRVSGVESRAYSLHHVVHSRISLKKPKLESELYNYCGISGRAQPKAPKSTLPVSDD